MADKDKEGREQRLTQQESQKLDAINSSAEQLASQLEALGEGASIDRAKASLERVVKLAEKHLKR